MGRTITEEKDKYIKKLLKVLNKDPLATPYDLHYDNLEDYLWELYDKGTSITHEIIVAIEKHLNK